MADRSIPVIWYTANPLAAPTTSEYMSGFKADPNGALWIRPIATLGAGFGIQTSRNPDSDGLNPATIVAFDVAAFNYVWDPVAGAWDRETRYTAADNMPSPDTTQMISFLMGYDSAGANWDQIRVGVDNADAQAAEGVGILKTISRLAGYNGATFDRLRTGNDNSDAIATGVTGLLDLIARSLIWNGANWMRDYKTAGFNAVTSSNVGAASTSILAASNTRRYLLIQNTHATQTLYINFGAAASASTLAIPPGGSYEPLVVPTSQIFGYGSAAATTYVIASA